MIDLPMDKIIEEYKNGTSTGILGIKYNCSRLTIRNRLIKAGVKIRSPAETNVCIVLPIDQICIDYEIGMDIIALVKKYKYSRSTIRNGLIKAGITLRSPSEINNMVLPIDQIIIDYENNIVPEDIAKKYNCSHETIRNRLIKSGITIRIRKDVINKSHLCVCVKCGDEFIGKTSAMYCYKCSPSEYCYKYNEPCRENNREKYNRECFLCGMGEEENRQKHSVHHVDYNKEHGCDDTIDWKLVPLCKACHGITGGSQKNRDMWEARIVYLYKEYWKGEV